MTCTNKCSYLCVILDYLHSDLFKKQRSFKIGLISIFLVVFFIGLLINIIQLSPNIFLRLSEESIGEADFIFAPSLGQKDVQNTLSSYESLVINNQHVSNINVFSTKLINFTELKDKLKNISFIRGLAPRWILQSNTTSVSGNNSYWAVSNIIILDSKLENQQGMGRKLHLPILKKGEAYISDSIYKSLRFDQKKDKNLTLSIRPLALYKALKKLDVNSAEDIEGIIDDDDDDDVKKKKKEKEQKKKKIELDMESDVKFVKSLLKAGNLTVITITKDDIINALKIPENFSISISLIKNPLIRNLPNMDEIIKMIDNKDSFLHKIFDIDPAKDRISLKKIPGNFTLQIDLIKELDKIPDIELDKYLAIEFNLTAVSVVYKSSGKWPSASGNVVAIDVNHINNYLYQNIIKLVNAYTKKTDSEFIGSILKNTTKLLIKTFNLNYYALSVNAIIKEKFDLYNRMSKDLRHRISYLTKQMNQALGYEFPVQIESPIFTTLSTMELGSAFLKDSLIIIMVFLWILCVLLVYSLMLGNVDERTYEFGMMRSLGLKKNNLIYLIILKGLFFAIPGIILGLTSSYIANNFVAFLFNWFSGLVMPFFLSFGVFQQALL